MIPRRHFLTATAGLAAAPAAPAPQPPIIELRYYHLRNGAQAQRTTDFLSKYYLPAAQRLGIGPLGFFNTMIGDASPSILVLAAYASADAFYTAGERLASDKEFAKGFDAYNSTAELSYIRMENTLLRAFDGLPRVVVPPTTNRPPLVFELRTYESNNEKTLRRKIQMFNDAEIGIMQRIGLMPVFYGEAIAGRNLPSLTYMLSFEGMPPRDRLWSAFGNDPEWQKLRAQPSVADGEIVSNISNAILRPLAFSPIR